MHNELTNLLPQKRLRALRRDYFLRLGVVAALFLIALVFASAVLLIPTYVFLTASQRTKEARLANIESMPSSAEEAAFSAQLAALSNNAATLTALADAPSAIATIRAALAVSHPGISLSGLVYSPDTEKGSRTLLISGLGTTRDALRNYQLAIQSAPFARSANLPVSTYAKDTNIDFTITVTLAP